MAAATYAVAQGAGAVGLPNVPNAHTGKQLKNVTDFNTALKTGKPDLWVRARYEHVDDDIPSSSPLSKTKTADLVSVRTVLGYSSARFHGLYGRVEFEANSRIGSDKALNLDNDLSFPPGPAGSRIKEGHAIIPDNTYQEFNEAYLGWRSATSGCPNAPGGCNGSTTIKAGRQQIIYDNHRWVGNIVWRQNFQSYDAIRIDNTSIKNLSLSYAYLKRVNRTFGRDSAFNKWEMDPSHLINISYKTPYGKLIGYGYLLNFKDNSRTPFKEGEGTLGTPGIASFDSKTFGVRFVGKHPFGESFSFLYDLEWANQDPYEDAGKTLDDNDYYNIEFGGAFKVMKKPVVVKVGREVLEGNGVNALQTPLATIHAFNGWADKFVGAPGGTATPVGGLEDTSATLIVKGLIGKSKLVIQYHNYESNKTVNNISDYGTEWGVLFAKPFTKEWLGLVKYANFDDGGDGFSVDTQKYWVMAQYRFK